MTTNPSFGPTTEGSTVAAQFADAIQGKTILITGVAPKSLGECLALTLSKHSPAAIILASRSPDKVSTVKSEVEKQSPDVAVHSINLNLASLASVREAAKAVEALPVSTIDIFINNAGVMNIPERKLSDDGLEMHLAVNHIGAFLLTTLLLPKIKAGRDPRIVTVTSNGHALSPFRFSDYNFDEKPMPENEQPPKAACEMFGVPWGLGYLPPVAYGQSKTANILFTTHLAASLKGQVTATCINPGPVATNLWREMPQEMVDQIFFAFPPRSIPQGIAPILVGTLDPALKSSSGAYVEANCQVAEPSSFATDVDVASKLWELSQKITGQT